MRRDVRLVVLVDKRRQWLPNKGVHVLADGVRRHRVVLDRYELVRVLYPEHLDHLPVQLRQVINLGGLRRHLQDGLILDYPLRHGGVVRVADRQHVYHEVVSAPRTDFAPYGHVCVLAGEDRSVVPFDAQATRLQAARQV